jgi:hypothetical protein
MRGAVAGVLVVVCLYGLGCDRRGSPPAGAQAEEVKGRPARSSFLDALMTRPGAAPLDELSPDPAQLGPGWTKDDLLVRLFASGSGSDGWNGVWFREVKVNRGFAADADRARFTGDLIAGLRRLASERGCELKGIPGNTETPPRGLRLAYTCGGIAGSIRMSVSQPNPADKTVYSITIRVQEPPQDD